MKNENIEGHPQEQCKRAILPVKDALDVLGGKWKLQIIVSLTLGTKRFKHLAREVSGITDKMLSKELRDLESNGLVKRTVYDAFPPVVEYELTEHGASLRQLIEALQDWGMLHRKKMLTRSTTEIA